MVIKTKTRFKKIGNTLKSVGMEFSGKITSERNDAYIVAKMYDPDSGLLFEDFAVPKENIIPNTEPE